MTYNVFGGTLNYFLLPPMSGVFHSVCLFVLTIKTKLVTKLGTWIVHHDTSLTNEY